MKPAKVWRVRVQRKVEDWVEVNADNQAEAELKASQLPGIVNVFSLSAIRGDKPVGTVAPQHGIEDDED